MVNNNGRYTTHLRVENGKFLYRDGDYPCGKEYMLVPSGTDSKGRRIFTEIEVWDKIPYNNRDWVPVPSAIAPNGYRWMSNGKSRFDENRRVALLRIKEDV